MCRAMWSIWLEHDFQFSHGWLYYQQIDMKTAFVYRNNLCWFRGTLNGCKRLSVWSADNSVINIYPWYSMWQSPGSIILNKPLWHLRVAFPNTNTNPLHPPSLSLTLIIHGLASLLHLSLSTEMGEKLFWEGDVYWALGIQIIFFVI